LDKDKETAKNVAIVVTALELDHCPIIKAPNWDNKKIVSLFSQKIEPKDHAGCEGHAAFVSTDYKGEAKAIYVCTDAPKHHDYKPPASSTHQEADLEKQRLGRQFKKDMVAPTQVRREWIRDVLLKKKLPLKNQAAFLCYIGATRRFCNNELTAELLGVKYDRLTQIKGEDKLMRCHIAQAISDVEEDTRLCQGLDHFRARGIDFYLTFLKNNGYVTSEHEEKFLA